MSFDKWSIFVKSTTLVVLSLLGIRVLVVSQPYRPTPGTKAVNYFNHPSAKPVALRLSSTTHYQLDGTNQSAAEFASLLPKGGHMVHIDNDLGHPEVYTVTLFHQLKCLDVIQSDYVSDRPSIQPLSPITRHCLNYLKQTFLCRPSLGIEWIVNPYAHAVRSYELVCNDWSEVYAEAERNQEAWRSSKNAFSGSI